MSIGANVVLPGKRGDATHESWANQAASVIKSLLLGGLLTLVGCGPTSDRLPITGTVTLDGAPLADGSIRFSSVGTVQPMTTGEMIQLGNYTISAEQGLRPGTYRVEITSPDADAKPVMVRIDSSGPGIQVQPDRIPKEYNVDSQKTVEVTIDGENRFDFDVVSKK